MPEATLRLDYIPFKVTTKKTQNKKKYDNSRSRLTLEKLIFFITFHVYEKKMLKRLAASIIAEDNKWVSSLMRSFDTTKIQVIHMWA
jgi:hypothetical protein